VTQDPKLLTPNSLPMPEDENNFWYFRGVSETVFVFVHGVLSDSRSCWLYEAKNKPKERAFWPDLVRGDERLDSPSIYLAGFDTSTESGDFSITDCAQDVFDALSRPQRRGDPPVMDSPEIIFICHSMGGIVVPAMLERNREKFRDKAIGLVLYATPSRGSVWADYISLLARYLNQRQVLQLRLDDSERASVHDRFRTLLNNRATLMPRLYGLEACETRMILRNWLPNPVQKLLSNRLRVVSADSASPYFGEVKKLSNTDHFSIVKPNDQSHPSHEFLVTFMGKFREHLRALEGMQAAARRKPFIEIPAFSESQSSISPHFELSPGGEGRSSELAVSVPQLNVTVTPTFSRQATEGRRYVEELFEIISDPPEVPRALFGTDTSEWLAPYDVEYVGVREGVSDVREAIMTALSDSGGRMAIRGPHGVGKTREVAEVAREYAARKKWKVLIAHYNDEANARMGPVAALPPQLIDAKVLVVVDNLHARVIAATGESPTYIERLGMFVQSLEAYLPGDVRLLCATRDDAHFHERLGLPQEKTRWELLDLFRLPRVTDEGLQQILRSLAAKAGVSIAPEDVPRVVKNSDRKIETLLLNVREARDTGKPLARDNWKPTEGESWKARFGSARQRSPGVDGVCQALSLLTAAGVPAKTPYVVSLASALGTHLAQPAVEALTGDGLLGMRQGILAPFSEEQLIEVLGHNETLSERWPKDWEKLAQAITDSVPRPPDWPADLLSLAHGLVRADALEWAEELSSRIIGLKVGDASPYWTRAGIRFSQTNWKGTVADLTTAISIKEGDTDFYFFRAATQNILGNYAEALDDLAIAMKWGRDDAPLHGLRGSAYYQMSSWNEAESALTAAMDRGDKTGLTVFSRGMVRYQLRNWDGADQDITAALERGYSFEKATLGLRQLERRAHLQQSEAKTPSAVEAPGGDPLLYALRGYARFMSGRASGAEQDLTVALQGKLPETLSRFAEAVAGSSAPMLSGLKGQLEAGEQAFRREVLFYFRGVTRLSQERPAEAEADFDSAIAGGFMDGEVYYGRAAARLGMERFVEAEQDARLAIERGKSDGPSYSIRGFAQLRLEKPIEAESDFDKSIELGRNDADVFFWRAQARSKLNKFQETVADLTAAMERGKTDGATFLTRGSFYFDLDKYAEAERDFDEALARGIDNDFLYTYRGLARISQGNVQGAGADLALAFERGAASVPAYSGRGLVNLRQNRFKEAEEDFTAAVALGRTDVWILSHRAWTFERLNRFADAEQDYSAVIVAGEVDPDVLVGRGRVRLAMMKWDDAAMDFLAACERGRDDADVHYLLGLARREQQRFAEAEAEFDAAIQHREDPAYYRFRGHARLVQANTSGAIEDLDSALAVEPSDAESLYFRGIASYATEKPQNAIADFDASLKISPDNPDIIARRLLAAIRLGQLGNAEEDCRRLQTISPDAPDTVGYSGIFELARGDFESAFSQFNIAAQNEKGWDSWQGLACVLTGRFKEAGNAYRREIAYSQPLDILLVRADLDFFANRYPDRVESPEAQTTLALIQGELRAKYPALDSDRN